MPARSLVAKVSYATPLERLTTNGGKKCGLASFTYACTQNIRW